METPELGQSDMRRMHIGAIHATQTKDWKWNEATPTNP